MNELHRSNRMATSLLGVDRRGTRSRVSAARCAPQSAVLAVRVRQHGDLSRAVRAGGAVHAVALQVFYLVMAVYGFIDWRKRPDGGRRGVLIRTWTSRQHVIAAVARRGRDARQRLAARGQHRCGRAVSRFLRHLGQRGHDLDGRASRASRTGCTGSSSTASPRGCISRRDCCVTTMLFVDLPRHRGARILRVAARAGTARRRPRRHRCTHAPA